MYTPKSLSFQSASYGRRLGALFYDTLASLAVMMLIGALWLPFYGGEAVPPGNLLYQCSLLGGLYLYFAYSWHKGQTLGMRAWRLYIIDVDGPAVSYGQTMRRFFLAALNILTLGLTYSWVDRWSHTFIYLVKK
jgi:uncharacterized RDD family membrane protein YckC